MASPAKSPASDQAPLDHEAANYQQAEVPLSENSKTIRTISKTPEPVADQPDMFASIQSSPSVPEPYDWDDFERRYEEALREANDHEREILKEAEGLSRVRTPCDGPSVHVYTDAAAVLSGLGVCRFSS